LPRATTKSVHSRHSPQKKCTQKRRAPIETLVQCSSDQTEKNNIEKHKMLSSRSLSQQQQQQQRRPSLLIDGRRNTALPRGWRATPQSQRRKRGELIIGNIGFDFGDGERESRRGACVCVVVWI
jgi:hypothetical protein